MKLRKITPEIQKHADDNCLKLYQSLDSGKMTEKGYIPFKFKNSIVEIVDRLGEVVGQVYSKVDQDALNKKEAAEQATKKAEKKAKIMAKVVAEMDGE